MIEYENLKKLNSPFAEEFTNKFKDILESGWYILGNNVKEFERNFSSVNDVKYTMGVASGLDALIISLKSLSLEKNSEVIVPSNTYIATILSIINNGLKPVLVEPDIDTYNIDPMKIEEKINSNTKAILVVHLYGLSCNMDPIIDIANKYNLQIIEDCAQSHLAEYKGRKVGTFGIGAFSFYPTKNLGGLGDGGAITTNNELIANKIKKLRNYGSDKKYHNELIGLNSRLDELQAGFLDIKLKYLNSITKHKKELAEIYLDNLDKRFITQKFDSNYDNVYHIFPIRYSNRNELKNYLLKNGIKTEIHYPIAPHNQKCMRNILHGEYPISEEIHDSILSLPISYSHTKDEIYKVVEVMNNYEK